MAKSKSDEGDKSDVVVGVTMIVNKECKSSVRFKAAAADDARNYYMPNEDWAKLGKPKTIIANFSAA